jgi:hypothetical protein
MHTHTAVLGMSFSGTTVLNYCLGSLPRSATISEAHWLVDEHPAGRRPSCRRCGSACEVLTDQFRDRLVGEPDFYRTIRERLGAEHLFSSDKNLKIYDRLEPCRRFSAIVLFKDPLYQLNSWLSAMARGGKRITVSECVDFLGYYVGYYESLLDEPVGGTKVILSCQEFQRWPERTLKMLCTELGLVYEPSAVRYWETTHHAIGGNFCPYFAYRKGGEEAVRVRDVRPAAFDPKLVAVAAGHRASQAVYERMLTLRLAIGDEPPPRPNTPPTRVRGRAVPEPSGATHAWKAVRRG